MTKAVENWPSLDQMFQEVERSVRLGSIELSDDGLTATPDRWVMVREAADMAGFILEDSGQLREKNGALVPLGEPIYTEILKTAQRQSLDTRT